MRLIVSYFVEMGESLNALYVTRWSVELILARKYDQQPKSK